MRLAALSDIHGNLPALEAVIADLHARNVEQVVVLGDSLSGPLWPVETAERIMALGWTALAGNHERQLLSWPIEQMGTTDAHTARQITPTIRNWMRDLPASLRLSPDLLLCHDTPENDNQYWLHRGKRGSMREATLDEIEAEAVDAALTLCGHTHLPRIVTLRDGRIVSNPGSVGLPAYEDGLPAYCPIGSSEPLARYLIAEKCGTGWAVELIAVPYDLEVSARRAEHNGRPSWAEALRTGMVR